MADNDEPEKRSNLFEQHVQTGIQLLIVALLAWFGMSVQSLQVSVAQLRAEQENLSAEISRLRDANRDPYPGSQARTDLNVIRDELRSLDRRMTILESRQQ